jgi:transketolase
MPVTQILFPPAEFDRVWAAAAPEPARLALVADMCRLNTLVAVKRAGSGHLGTSFSAMDIVVWLYYAELDTLARGIADPGRDVYFSSKGHDVPGLYAVFHSRRVLSREQLLSLRRLGGLDGHPEVHIPGIEANSGSLGMGISKAKGMAWAKRHAGRSGRVFVMTGDGELQEGQNFEALQTAVHQRLDVTVIVDNNRVQSDKPVAEIVDLGDLVAKVRGFGWQVARCDGHDPVALRAALAAVRSTPGVPGMIVADTIKGKGISFMEHPTALAAAKGLYAWHAGAPADDAYEAGRQELLARVAAQAAALGLEAPVAEPVAPEAGMASAKAILELAGEPVSEAAQARISAGVSSEYVAKAYGEELVVLGREVPTLVVLDGDLAADCRIRDFEHAFPERFIENGIAEQDMVSMAGGLARHGLLPVVNSFASFLAARANEQIYNNATEGSRIIYALHFGGLIPAGPGKSHQSIRDVSLLAALPNMIIVQPANAWESRALLRYCVLEATDNCAIRLAIGPSPRLLDLPADYAVVPGRGVALTTGDDAALIAYGPVMLHEALLAAELLAERGVGLRVINMPWLNRVDGGWLAAALGDVPLVTVLDDHAPVGALGDAVLSALAGLEAPRRRRVVKIGVDGYPACGTPAQALRHHRLDGLSLAERVLELRPTP